MDFSFPDEAPLLIRFGRKPDERCGLPRHFVKRRFVLCVCCRTLRIGRCSQFEAIGVGWLTDRELCELESVVH
jgi:hypothetical protein